MAELPVGDATEKALTLAAETNRLMSATCSRCGTYLDPDGTCFVCPLATPQTAVEAAFVDLCPNCHKESCRCPSLEELAYGSYPNERDQALQPDQRVVIGKREAAESGRRGLPYETVSNDVNADILTQLTEDEAEPSFLDKLRAELVDSAGLDNIPDPEPLIGEDILFRDSLVWMVGKPGCMKSFTALDMAGCVGTGEHWQGWPVAQGPVLYLVAEGVRGTKKRVRAWEKAMGRTMDNVHFLPVAVQSKHAGQWAAFVELAAEVKPTLIVLDTQARITVGVEENSNTEMGEFVHQAERLRRATEACVIIVHHIGRTGDTGRGATTLDGAMSTIIKVTKDEGRVKLECTKNKDGEEWEDITLRAVPMGESIVLVGDDSAFGPPSETSLASKKWVHEWWKYHEREPVSVAVLVKSDVVTEPTFHRSKRQLVDQGLAVKEGSGNATRYRLSGDPALR